MPSLIGTDIAANYRVHQISQSDVGMEMVMEISATVNPLTNAKLEEALFWLTTPHGTGDGTTQTDNAYTVAAVGTADGSAIDWTTWTTDSVYVRVQGTTAFTDANMATNTDCSATTVAIFKPAL